jgi:hypothetical protein
METHKTSSAKADTRQLVAGWFLTLSYVIGSPVTALPAFAYAALQVWYGIRVYRQNCGNPHF